MKRFFALSLIAMLTAQAWATRFHSGDLYYNTTSDNTVEVTYKELSRYNYSGLKNISIPNSVTYNGAEYTVTSIGYAAFAQCTSLTSIEIPYSVTTIGQGAFQDCTSLTSITIPNSVTSIETGAFANCSRLTSVTIGNSVANLDMPFWGCSQLTEINVANDNANYTSENNILFNKDKTILVYYSAAKTDESYSISNTITSISDCAFYGCKNLTSIEIPNSVTNIGDNAFGNCRGLTSIKIPNSVTSIGVSAFYGCNALTKAEFASIESLCKIYFYDEYANPLYITKHLYINNEEITEVIIPDGVTSIEQGAFTGCSGITSITIPNSITYIGAGAFYNCDNLSYNIYDNAYYLGNDENPYFALIKALSTDITSCEINSNCKHICSQAFTDCKKLTSINLPNTLISIGNIAFQHCELLESINIPNTVTNIGWQAFIYCYELASINIPNSVTSIGPGAFAACYNLASVTFAEGSQLTSIDGQTFAGCGLSSINIPNSVTTIGKEAFYGCSLTSATIPNSVISIGENAFKECDDINFLSIPNSVTSIGNDAFNGVNIIIYSGNATGSPWGAFNIYSAIDEYGFIYNDVEKTLLAKYVGNDKDIIIPDGVTSIGDNAFYDENTFLYEYHELNSVSIPNTVTSIGKNAFAMHNELAPVFIPNSVTNIGNNAFYQINYIIYSGTATGSPWGAYHICQADENGFVITENTAELVTYIGNDTDITIPDGVTSICGQAFMNCTGLSSINIPTGVTTIGNYAFSGCSSLKSITFGSSVAEIGPAALANCSNLQIIECKSETPPVVLSFFGGNATLTGNSLQDAIIYDNVSLVFPEGARLYRRVQPWSNFPSTYMATITVTSANPAMGMTIGNGSYMIGTSTEIAAIEKSGHHFVRWNDGVTDNPRSISITGNATYSAVFAVNVYNVTVTTENGTISGTGEYTHGSRATLTATPNDGYHFVRWSNGSINSSITVKVTEDLEFDAEFAINVYKISAISENGTVSGIGEYNHGNNATLTAMANTGYHFVKWEDDEDAEATRTISVTEDKTYTAVFEAHSKVVEFENKVFATCTKSGSRDSVVYCTVCNKELSRNTLTIKALGHTEVVDAAVPVTCTTAGKTEGKHCSVCNAILAAQEEIAAPGHKVEVDLAVPATCTVTGRTDGKHCSVCNTILMAQKEVPAFGHEFGEYVYNNDATAESDGTETALCKHGCGASVSRVAIGTKLAGTPENGGNGTAVEESAANAVSIHAHHNIIVVENATDEIRVYNAMGKLVGMDASLGGRVELQVTGAGVYIVKTGGIVKRVMVN